MNEYDVTWVSVFAERPHEGNLLAVVHEADSLLVPEMARLARRLLQPETSFLQRPSTDAATYRHRIFTIAGEIRFAGHPSLGAAAAFSVRTGEKEMTIVQETLSGQQRLDITTLGQRIEVSLTQNPIEFLNEIDATAIFDALGVSTDEQHPELSAQIVSTGLPALILPTKGAEVVTRAVLDRSALTAALEGTVPNPRSINCYLVGHQSGGSWRARSFSLDLTEGEDPATGSAAGPFGAYLQKHCGIDRVTVTQGVELGSPSELRVDCSHGIVVSGTNWIVGNGSFRL
jgi:trans-2,3-dihydro-3-hydroxyanthranilate isomerase